MKGSMLLMRKRRKRDSNVESWKLVAQNWRTVEDTVVKLSIVQKVTQKALKEVKEKQSFVSARDFFNAPAGLDDDLP